MSANRSTGLFPALLAVQKDAPTLPKDKTARVQTKTGGSYQYSYTDLATVVEKIVPALAENGLVWTTLPGGTHDQPTLSYRLTHAETGESLDGTMPLLMDGKTDAQALGSALTYARRYSLCAVLNLVTDEDDDGTAASTQRTKPAKPAKQPPKPPNAKATPSQIRRIYEEGESLPRMQLCNIVRAAYGGQPLNLSEPDAKARLEGGMANLTADKVPFILAAIAEAKGA